jgi:L-ascorbate metabolism protein UlaG (beta-lactamase superfamily)
MCIAASARVAAVAAVVLWTCTGLAFAQQVEVLWLGHSAFRITSTTGKVIVIDPFLKKNLRTPAKYKDLSALGKVDLILVTHGHGDHVADLGELASLTGAIVVANFELANNLVALGVLEGSKTIAMNQGGTVAPLGPGIKVHMVHAEHTSSVDMSVIKPESTGLRHFDGGVPVGYVIEFENGFTIYDTGDTNVFGDMALISRFFKPDLALVCIGGHFTMDPELAAFALRELIRPKQVIAQHYGTFPVINRTPAELKAALGNSPIKVLDMKPGDVLKF